MPGLPPSEGIPGKAAAIEVERLLSLALSDPERALTLARSTLDDNPGSQARSLAHQAAGIVLRDRGDLTGALLELRSALRWARRVSGDRVADVCATYGAALVMAGYPGRGVRQLDQALSLARGDLRARVRLRRAYVWRLLARYPEALTELSLAVRSARRSGNVLWEADVLNNRCMVHLALGAVERADGDAAAAERLYTSLGHDLFSAQAMANRGVAALRRGKIPAALQLLDKSAERFDKLGVTEPELVIDRGHALLAAGMAPEVVSLVEDFLESQSTLRPVDRAELEQMAAAAALGAGNLQKALEHGRLARRLFVATTQPRRGTERFACLRIRYAAGQRNRRLMGESLDLAERLGNMQSEDAPMAYLMAGRLALELGEVQVAAAALAEAARYRFRGPALRRATGWLAVAIEAETRGQSRRLLVACRRGLDAIDEHSLTFGATEMRAWVTTYGRELAMIALKWALRHQGPRGRPLLVRALARHIADHKYECP